MPSYNNSERVLRDMETYDVDMCILLSGFGMTNEMNQEIIEENPNKFIATTSQAQRKKKILRGEEEWTWEAAPEKLDKWLSENGFYMTSESIRGDPTRAEPVEWGQRKKDNRHVEDVPAKHDVPVRWHTGCASGCSENHLFNLFPDWGESDTREPAESRVSRNPGYLRPQRDTGRLA